MRLCFAGCAAHRAATAVRLARMLGDSHRGYGRQICFAQHQQLGDPPRHAPLAGHPVVNRSRVAAQLPRDGSQGFSCRVGLQDGGVSVSEVRVDHEGSTNATGPKYPWAPGLSMNSFASAHNVYYVKSLGLQAAGTPSRCLTGFVVPPCRPDQVDRHQLLNAA